MTTVDPPNCTRFRNSFRAAADYITKGLSTRRAAAANGNLENWAEFYRDMALDPLLISYRDPAPILKNSVSPYRTRVIAPSGRQVQSHKVEDAVRLIG